MASPSKPRKVKLGTVTPWTDAELDAMSQITMADIAKAQETLASWPEAARLNAFLNAQPMPEPEA